MQSNYYYGMSRRPTRQAHSGGLALRTAFCLMLCAAAFCCKQYWPAGAAAMEQVVFGTTEQRAQTAFAAFSDAMAEGEPVTAAFSELCDAVFTRAD